MRVIDDFAAGKLRQIEAKYPVINTSTENVLHKFNEKTEPVRNVINTVKDTTTTTIQHGKETVTEEEEKHFECIKDLFFFRFISR